MIEELKKIITEDEAPTVSIIIHTNPDPDCIGAAKGLEKLLKCYNQKTVVNILYDGEISHPQNKTMLKILNISLSHSDQMNDSKNLKDLSKYFICIDTTPENLHKSDKYKDIEFLATIDHHPIDTEQSTYKDIRQLGSSCTIVWEYLKKENIEFDDKSEDDSNIATAMLIGIKTDTMDLVSEKTTDLDFEAFKNLLNYASKPKLASITNYPIPPYLFELRGRLDKEGNTDTYNGLYIGGIGYITPSKRDALPTIAEERARTEGIDTSFIFAVVGDNIEVSIRSNSPSVDVKTLCHKIFGKQNGGGHPRAGATKIPMGFLSIKDMNENMQEKMWTSVRDLIIYKIKTEVEQQR